MGRLTYTQLAEEVRQQVDVTVDQACAWLLDRARAWNAEAGWLVKTISIPLTLGRYYELPSDLIAVEAVLLGSRPYQRSTPHALDARYAGDGSWSYGVYAEGASDQGMDLSEGTHLMQIHPDVSGATLQVRYVADVPDSRSDPTPFPTDFDEPLVEGAIAIGLARMDERFDSANYFDERYRNAGERLKRRAHGIAGRGATSIRVVT